MNQNNVSCGCPDKNLGDIHDTEVETEPLDIIIEIAVGSEVFTAVVVKSSVFWDIMLCS
jgi:hypothetical protein